MVTPQKSLGWWRHDIGIDIDIEKMPNIDKYRTSIGSIWKNWYRPTLTIYSNSPWVYPRRLYSGGILTGMGVDRESYLMVSWRKPGQCLTLFYGRRLNSCSPWTCDSNGSSFETSYGKLFTKQIISVQQFQRVQNIGEPSNASVYSDMENNQRLLCRQQCERQLWGVLIQFYSGRVKQEATTRVRRNIRTDITAIFPVEGGGGGEGRGRAYLGMNRKQTPSQSLRVYASYLVNPFLTRVDTILNCSMLETLFSNKAEVLKMWPRSGHSIRTSTPL